MDEPACLILLEKSAIFIEGMPVSRILRGANIADAITVVPTMAPCPLGL